ncbi:hypothetical protein CPAR01_00080, partial [Colletotrichum paranaense]
TAVEGHDCTNTTNARIIDWHNWVRSNGFELSSQVINKRLCHNSMCQSIRSEIDSGLAGYGFLDFYGIECILLAVYCAFALPAFAKRDKTSSSSVDMLHASQSNGKSGLFDRDYEAMEGTKYDLFMAATSLFVGIQAIVIYSQVRPSVYEYSSSLQLIVSGSVSVRWPQCYHSY